MEFEKVLSDKSKSLIKSTNKKENEIKEFFVKTFQDNLFIQNLEYKSHIIFNKLNQPERLDGISIKLSLNIKCTDYYNYQLGDKFYKFKPLTLVKNLVSMKRDSTINIFLKDLSLIKNQEEILEFVKENKYYTVVYQIERINDDETDESLSDSTESIDKEKLKKMKEKMKLKKKKYLMKKKNRPETSEKVEESEEDLRK